jgi:betaine lipid synthase
MASLTPSTLVLLIGVIFAVTFHSTKKGDEENPSALGSFLRFFYASFLKPHNGDGLGEGQQAALESFYKAQAGVYDATRKRLLRGREDMLGLVAAQLVQKAASERTHDPKRIWVDVSVATTNLTERLTDNSSLADRWWHRLEHRSNIRIRRCSRILL